MDCPQIGASSTRLHDRPRRRRNRRPLSRPARIRVRAGTLVAAAIGESHLVDCRDTTHCHRRCRHGAPHRGGRVVVGGCGGRVRCSAMPGADPPNTHKLAKRPGAAALRVRPVNASLSTTWMLSPQPSPQVPPPPPPASDVICNHSYHNTTLETRLVCCSQPPHAFATFNSDSLWPDEPSPLESKSPCCQFVAAARPPPHPAPCPSPQWRPSF